MKYIYISDLPAKDCEPKAWITLSCAAANDDMHRTEERNSQTYTTYITYNMYIISIVDLQHLFYTLSNSYLLSIQSRNPRGSSL